MTDSLASGKVPFVSMARSFVIQRRVIHALLMREVLTRYGRDNIGFLWLFLEPMLFTLGIAALWSLTLAAHGQTISPISFALTGYSVLLTWRNVGSRCLKAIEPNLALMFHRNVTLFDVIATRALLEIAGGTSSFLLLSLLFHGLGMVGAPYDILGLIGAWALLCWFACALGLLVGAISEMSDFLDRIWHIIVYLMFPLSGAVFLVDWLPTSFQDAALWIPMVNITEMLRLAFYGPIFRPHFDLGYVIAFNSGLTIIALALLRQVGRRMEIE